VDDVAFERCVALLRTRQYRRGDTIFHQGDLGDSLHVIESGSVKIVLPSPEGEEEAIIATLGPGDFFGELSLLDGEERSATAIAQEATVTSILRRDVFESLLESDRGLRRALFEGMAAEIRRLTHHVAELHFLNLPGRLARRVVRLAQQADPQWSAVRLRQLLGHGARQPVVAHQVAHRCARAHPSKDVVVVSRQHVAGPFRPG